MNNTRENDLSENNTAPKQILIKCPLAHDVGQSFCCAATLIKPICCCDFFATLNCLRCKNANTGRLAVAIDGIFPTGMVHFGKFAEQGAAANCARNNDFERVGTKASYEAPEK